jgi:hypothetical protein
VEEHVPAGGGHHPRPGRLPHARRGEREARQRDRDRTAARLFENRFRVVLRDSFGDVLAARSVSATGRWSVTLHYTAPQGQGASFEAAASSAKDGALACLVQRGFALPASNARANLHVVYRAYADVNGDQRLDLVTLRRISASGGGWRSRWPAVGALRSRRRPTRCGCRAWSPAATSTDGRVRSCARVRLRLVAFASAWLRPARRQPDRNRCREPLHPYFSIGGGMGRQGSRRMWPTALSGRARTGLPPAPPRVDR